MVTEIAISPGTEVKAGDTLVVIEAMKMLTTVSTAFRKGSPSAGGREAELANGKGRRWLLGSYGRESRQQSLHVRMQIRLS